MSTPQPTNPVSPSIVNALPRPKSPSQKLLKRVPAEIAQFLKRSPATFRAMGNRAIGNATLAVYVEANKAPDVDGWAFPNASQYLSAIQENLANYPVANRHEPVTSFALNHRMRIEVGIYVPTESESAHFDARHTCGTAFHGWSGDAIPLVSLLTGATVLVPGFRWKREKGSVSVPGGHFVAPPYLAVSLVDEATRLAVRLKLYPVFFDPISEILAIVRSQLERIAFAAVAAAGGVVYVPFGTNDLKDLQARYGNFWRGNISKYPYRPDQLLMPNAGAKVSIVEILGLLGYKRYAEGASEKCRVGRAGEIAGNYNFLKINGRDLARHSLRHDMESLILSHYGTLSNSLWQSTGYAKATQPHFC